ncbi:hypothetical protein HanIR_Chr15g0760481 [Helianthus annuus]|nr:hypothetical protein HanIR_Chr15g0760481 [Helianthus annuus]
MGYIYPLQITMHEGSCILVEGSSINQKCHRKISKDPNIPRRMVYPSRSISIIETSSFEVIEGYNPSFDDILRSILTFKH